MIPTVRRSGLLLKFKDEATLRKTLAEKMMDVRYGFTFNTNVYRRVTSIAGERITPDIDLLEIKKELPLSDEISIGYELKVLGKAQNEVSLTEFYKGLGQTISLFKYGVHRAVLVLAFKEVANELIMKFLGWLKPYLNVFVKLFEKSVGIALYTYDRYGLFDYVYEPQENYHLFPSDSEEQFLRNAILQRRFKCEKRYESERLML